MQAIVGDKTIAFLLMDEEMYSGMSCLTEPSPTVERGLALHKVCSFQLVLLLFRVVVSLTAQLADVSTFFPFMNAVLSLSPTIGLTIHFCPLQRTK